MEKIIKQILEVAINAPSGDNAQPWKFSILENTLRVFNIPQADNSAYNFMERGSLVSQGALLENIFLASLHFGYQANIRLFPESNDPNLVAKISWEQSAQNDSLFPAISERATNRKTYKNQDILPEHEQELLSLPLEQPLLKFSLLKDRRQISTLSNVLSLNERIFLENYHVHKGLFSFIRWTKVEEEQTGTGLYIKTLELAPPQEWAMKLFRHWPIINFFNKFNFASLVAKDSAQRYASSSAFGLLAGFDKSKQSLVASGRMLERVWLTATKLGISLQPTAALLYLAQRIEEEERNKMFSERHASKILEAEKKIKEIFGLTNEIPLMLFRLGYADPPTARSVKHPPIIV